jgi:DNA-binding NarL/FixJ family response regulator
MRNQTVLLIDEDEVVLSLLQKSLVGHSPTHKILIESTPAGAIQRLGEQAIDLVIADLPSVTARETHLLDTLSGWKTPGKAVVVTAYNYQRVAEVNIGALTNAYLLPKPIKMNDLKQVMDKVLGRPADVLLEKPEGADQQLKAIQKEIEELRRNTHARTILLNDSSGNILYRLGTMDGLPLEAFTSLLCAGLATLVEAGKSLDDGDAINLAYREGKLSDLYAINISGQWVMVLVIDRGQNYERLGSVWYYARKSALQLKQILDASSQEKTKMKFDGAINQAYSDELDKLFS